MASCCISLDRTTIYLLDAYAAGAGKYGYSASYGSIYGNTSLNSISAFDIGRELGVASAVINIETIDINSDINSFNSSVGKKLKNVSIDITTECWSNENLSLFLGASVTSITASTVTEYLYSTYIPADTAIIKNGTLTNVSIVNTSTSQALIQGIDYLIILNRIVFIKDFNIAASLTLTYTMSEYTQITPYQDQNNDFKAFVIAGRNIADNNFVTFKFPKVKIGLNSTNYDIFADSYIPLNLSGKCYDGFIAGMPNPAPFIMIRGNN